MFKYLLMATLLVTHAAQAQHFEFGLKGGVNFSNFTGGDFNDIDNKTLVGFHAGGFMRLHFGDLIAVQPELLFSTQGAKLESATESIDAKVSYINVPILLQLHFGGLFVEGGPQVGFRVNEDVPNQSIENFAKSNDLSLALGLGYQSHSGFGISGRYNIGLSKVGDFEATNINPDFKNGVAQISLFYTFFNKNKK